MKYLRTLLIVLFVSSGSALWSQPAVGAGGLSFPPMSWDMTCTEMVAHYNVDIQTAEKLLPAGYTLKVNEFGAAILFTAVQECSNIVLNGSVNTGPAKLSHVWIGVEGAPGIDPVPGAIDTWPTEYWYDYGTQTDNLFLAAAMMFSGLPVELVDKITLGGTDPTRTGEVVERQHPTVTYSWQETSSPQTPPLPFGSNHWLYKEQIGPGGPTLATAKLRCLLWVHAWSTSVLNADPRSLIGKMGFEMPVYAPVALDFTQGCHVDFQVKRK